MRDNINQKVKIYVRFPNDGEYYTKINVNPTKIEDPMIFMDEVFVTIDGIRVAMKKKDWNNLKLKENE
jgi:hypothetical protein